MTARVPPGSLAPVDFDTRLFTRISLRTHPTGDSRARSAQARGSTHRSVPSTRVVASVAVSPEHRSRGVESIVAHGQSPALADTDAVALARVRAKVPNLLESYPLERYLALLDSEGGYGGYSRVPKSVESLCVEIQHRHGTRVLEDYHRLLLLTLVRDFDERLAGRRYPPSVLALYRTYRRHRGAPSHESARVLSSPERSVRQRSRGVSPEAAPVRISARRYSLGSPPEVPVEGRCPAVPSPIGFRRPDPRRLAAAL